MCPPFRDVCHLGGRAAGGADPRRSAAPDADPIERGSQLHRLTCRVSARSFGSRKRSRLCTSGRRAGRAGAARCDAGARGAAVHRGSSPYRPHVFVVSDRALVDLANFVRGAVGEAEFMMGVGASWVDDHNNATSSNRS